MHMLKLIITSVLQTTNQVKMGGILYYFNHNLIYRLWSNHLMEHADWAIEFGFSVKHDGYLSGDGLAFWYSSEADLHGKGLIASCHYLISTWKSSQYQYPENQFLTPNF